MTLESILADPEVRRRIAEMTPLKSDALPIKVPRTRDSTLRKAKWAGIHHATYMALTKLAENLLSGTFWTIEDIQSPSREAPCVKVRDTFIRVAHENKHSNSAIARYLNRDQTTVSCSLRRTK